MDCAKISKNLAFAACDTAVTGIDPTLILLNYEDIDRVQSTPTAGVLSEIVMKALATGVRYTSHKNAFEGDSTLAKGTYQNKYDHKVVCRVFSKTQEIKGELNKLSQGKVVAIVKNVDNRNPETKYEVYGWDSGLEMSELSAPTTDADGVVYTFALASGDRAKESELPLSFYSVSLEQTETALEALVAKGK